LAIVGKVGDALAPKLIEAAPTLLLFLNANDLHLALTSTTVGPLPWMAIGMTRRLLEDPICFLLGWRYRSGAIRLLAQAFPRLNVARAEAGFRRASHVAILLDPGLVVCTLAGATRVHPATFAVLNVVGTAARLLVIRATGTLLPSHLSRLLELLHARSTQALLLCVAIVQAGLTARPLIRSLVARSSYPLEADDKDRNAPTSEGGASGNRRRLMVSFSHRRIGNPVAVLGAVGGSGAGASSGVGSVSSASEKGNGAAGAQTVAATSRSPEYDDGPIGDHRAVPADEGIDTDERTAPLFAELRLIWRGRLRPLFEETLREDPLFRSSASEDALLARFLNAERRDAPRKPATWVPKAAARLEQMAIFRRDYRCRDFHTKGMARRLMMHASNPGATVYFGDMGLRAVDGGPVLVGRVSLMIEPSKPSDNMRAETHLRAGVMVAERALSELPAGVKGSYVLDVGAFPKREMAPHGKTRYWDADGEASGGGGVGPHLPGHESLTGLSVLREAMRLMATFYPETLHKVFFYRPGVAFRLCFAVFRLWAPPATRSRFVLVREGHEDIFFTPPGQGGCGLDRETAPLEFGGRGPSLGGDRFLMRALQRYDNTATLDAQGGAG
jgi:membrane protein DedA with SNARE-associated domain